jgi:tetratricopeptide (TPR) repeat protein
MRLQDRLICMLATCVVACASCIAAAAAQSSAPSPESWALCASRAPRLADQAIEACSAIISASDTDSEAAATAYGYRGIALRRRSGNAQDVEAGLRDLEKAVSSGLDTAIAYVFRGQLDLARQNPDLAIADCDEAIRRDPQIALAFAVRGAAFAAKRDFERSAVEYGEAIRIDPTYAIAFLARARAYIARADWGRAIGDLDQALQLDSTPRLLADAFTNRASARLAMSDVAGAIADCDEALKLNASDAYAPGIRASAFVTRARASMARADWSRAISDLDQALPLDSTPQAKAYAFAIRATARYQMSDFAGAIADCDEALKLNASDEQALRVRASAHAAQGTASSTDGAGATPDALVVYVAHGPAGACGEKCEEWIAVEGTVDWQGPQRLLATLDRLGARKLPVVLNFRGVSNFYSSMSIGKILRERGVEATVGQTLVDECDDPLQPKCAALKRAGKPLQATLVPIQACDVACVLGLSGGVRRTLPDATTVIIGGMAVGNRIGLRAPKPFRDEHHVRMRDLVMLHLTQIGVDPHLVKQHLAQMGVDPQLADIMEEHDDFPRATELSRKDIARLRIVTTQ